MWILDNSYKWFGYRYFIVITVDLVQIWCNYLNSFYQKCILMQIPDFNKNDALAAHCSKGNIIFILFLSLLSPLSGPQPALINLTFPIECQTHLFIIVFVFTDLLSYFFVTHHLWFGWCGIFKVPLRCVAWRSSCLNWIPRFVFLSMWINRLNCFCFNALPRVRRIYQICSFFTFHFLQHLGFTFIC